MNINDLTISQVKEVINLFNMDSTDLTDPADSIGLSSMINKKVIIRTYSAGVHFGTLIEKSGTEVILKNTRRLWHWHASQSISLSAVALYGVKQDKSKIIETVPEIWLDAIEIIPCSNAAIQSIEGCENVTAS